MDISKRDNKDPVELEDPFFYTVDVVNNGPGSATEVTIIDTLPEGLEFIDYEIVNLFDSCTVTLPIIECEISGTFPLTDFSTPATEAATTATVEIHVQAVSTLGPNVLTNGDFETPIIASGVGWDVYESSEVTPWEVEWTERNHCKRSDPGYLVDGFLELQDGAGQTSELGDPHDGLQWAELDTDCQGPGGNSHGKERTSVKITQEVPTIDGETYELSYASKARPGTHERTNALDVKLNGDKINEIFPMSEEWEVDSHRFVASDETKIQFIDDGRPDSLGTFLDSVSLNQIIIPTEVTNVVTVEWENPDGTTDEETTEETTTIGGSGELFCGKPQSEYDIIKTEAPFIGGDGPDLLIGTSSGDVMKGRGGNDCIIGNGGFDRIFGGWGDDDISGNGDRDVLRGGPGDDIISGGEGRDNISGNGGDDTIRAGDGDDRVSGGRGDDNISGGDGKDRLRGNIGDDDIFGNNGDDTILGGPGDDNIYGGPHDNGDKCLGGAGDDFITECEFGDPNTGGGDTKQLTGTIRDFHKGHPNMELGCSGGKCSGVELGIVGPLGASIGADKTPVFTQASLTTTDADDFYDWYHDVPGINLSDEITITLDNTITSDPSVYTFESGPGFFPIDDDCEQPCNPLFGNEENPHHNYHFTIEFHSSIKFQDDQMFKFTGDDDVWVYINDILVIDLGGVHPQTSETIESEQLVNQFGLQTGQTYDLDIFFAERQTVQSNFRIDTSMIMD